MGRLLVRERLELGDQPAVLAERQFGLDALLERGEPQLVEPRDRRHGERLVGEVRERRPPPQRERRLQQGGRAIVLTVRERRGGLVRQALEPAQVERVAAGADEVARRPRLDHRAEELAQVGHLALHLGDRGRRRLAPVELVREPVDRDDAVGVQEQDRQHSALARAAEADRRVGAEDLERAQDAELELDGWRTDSEPIAALPSMAHRQRGPQEVVMSGQPPRSSRTALTAIVAVLAMTALAAPAGAQPTADHGVPTAPVNARGTDVAAPDQQAQRPVVILRRSGTQVVNAPGTDVAAPDQQNRISPRPNPVPVSPADRPGDASPTPTLLALLALGLCLAGVAFASRLAVTRRRSRVTA